MNMKTVKCPTCGKPVPWTPESRYRPFCSERCKQIDLGAWAAEQYTIPVVENDDLPPDAPGGESGGASGRLN
ncbi:DNA gyrase inhibitor YacG [Ralstonia solanacearum]|uniref:DNA gyrase inhibitor YacG n=2 Tax=Ralstonia solanacearum species complex TaxID=3116862 RepID=A0A0S4V073_RALSL|nr:DNA gyrase inhibitor YacG [Ralstonia pseudosolanacearum]AUS41442.1 DNA gyrase inhibitor YacG [Ralstonia solanacearum]ASL73911.1 DNA gyrase inhibitor [Ralstonia pseudosolanacearum]AST85489.1 DNA gyrase inhibitor YacG [Ralstonia pseudosolanacearum]AYA45547.1 DNA gyrase inhibitor YacG [Ralstonia pseudosolanacearum]MCK4116844.1 DNA gyrase inhibitor YacG [Ralstonia pseudosolanacearum]